jgi:Xaa-Pro aminopeptidase
MKEKIEALRGLMKKFGLDAYLIPSTDPHQDEYIPAFWQRRKFISGFKGSAGDVVITHFKAGLWTDSRYFLQAEQELDHKVFTLYKQGIPGVTTIKEWLAEELGKGKILGVDSQVLSHHSFEDLHSYLDDRGIQIKSVQKNLVDAVWEDRPSPPKQKIQVHPLKYSGESVKKKLERVRKKMAEQPTDFLVIAALDEIAWLFNIRGRDIEFNPVVIAYALISDNSAVLFLDPDKLTKKSRNTLEKSVEISNYENFFPKLHKIAHTSQGARVWIDPNRVSQRIVNILKRNTKILFSPGPIPFLKAVKNPTEIQGFRSAHVRDGVAMVKFLSWLEETLKSHRITEQSAADKLEEFRARDPFFRGISFETISAYRAHSAIVHYSPDFETDSLLHQRDIYLIDSGAQYTDATTDITRTICLGRPQTRQRNCFTRVLKGLIGLSRTSFPQGTAGRQLDTIARLPLWKNGQNYGHGTGHGIGSYLNVHEGPHAISPRCVGVALEPGMITSIEPGIYLEKQFGIRLENVVLVAEDEKNSTGHSRFYKFETLTLCPIDLQLVKREMLHQEEVEWLNAYHKQVRKILWPHIGKSEKMWLTEATRPI